MSVEFDPVPIGRQRRRKDPVVVIVVILVGLAIAVLKPWERGPAGQNGIAAASASPPTGGHATATVLGPTAATSASPDPTSPPRPALSWSNVERSPFPNPGFSVDVVSVDWSASTGSAGYPVFFEGWHTPTPDGPTVLDTRGQSIVALGVATDRGSVAEDVRIWRVRANGDLDWVDANPIDGAVSGGPLVLAIPGQAIAFPAGRYRIDALVDGAIRRVDVAVPGSTGRIPPLTDTPYPTVAGLVSLTSSDPSAVLTGPFATVDGEGFPLDVVPVEPLDETGAWNASLAPGSLVRRPTVARLFLPRATGLGVMLAAHARIQTAEITRLAPDANLLPVTAIGGVTPDRGGTPWIGFAAPGDGAWPPGVYALTVSWTDGAESRTGTWHVELRPGPSTPSAPGPG